MLSPQSPAPQSQYGGPIDELDQLDLERDAPAGIEAEEAHAAIADLADSLAALTSAGVSVWLGDLSREHLDSGSLAELITHQGLVGVTTNPTIFAKAISHGAACEPQIRDLAVRGVSTDEALRTLTASDARQACDLLRPVYEATNGVDGRVSIELEPRLARNTEATIAEARALWWMIDRPNLYIKIPATDPGTPAISRCLAEGISINVTLIFSLARHEAGMEQAKHAEPELSRIGSVASFLSPGSTAKLMPCSTGSAARMRQDCAAGLRGRTAIANARLAYQRYEEVFSSPRWPALHADGADYRAVVSGLVEQGAALFEASWEALCEQLSANLSPRLEMAPSG